MYNLSIPFIDIIITTTTTIIVYYYVCLYVVYALAKGRCGSQRNLAGVIEHDVHSATFDVQLS